MAKFTPELFQKICDRIAQGESLRAICTDKAMPSREAVRKWLARDDDLVGQYARAREDQGDYYFDEVIGIADSATPEDVAVARLKIDARKWAAGKLRPKVYGDKVDLNHSGSFSVVIGGDDADL